MLSSLVFISGCGVTGGSSFSSITSGITSTPGVTRGFCTGSNPDMCWSDGGFGVVFRISWLSSFVFFYLIHVTLYFLSDISYHIPIGTSVRRSSGRRSGVAVRAVDCWQ